LSNKYIEDNINRGLVNLGCLIVGAEMFEALRGGPIDLICDFLARCVWKLYSNLYIKTKLSKLGLSFLDHISPSDITYVITLIENSKEVWCQAISDGTNDDTAGGEEGEKKAPKPRFTSWEGKKRRVFGETVWNKAGRLFFQQGVENWSKAFDKTSEEYKILCKAWDKWVDKKANQMVLGKWTKKTMQSVLAMRKKKATRKKRVEAGVSPQQGRRGAGSDEDGGEVVKKFGMTPTWNLISHIIVEEMMMKKMGMVRLGLWMRKMEGVFLDTWGRGREIMVMIMMRVVRAVVKMMMKKN
jgi:hypothetical protein